MENINQLNLTKQIRKMILRIEKLMIPSNSMVINTIGPKLEELMKRVQEGIYYVDPEPEVKLKLKRASSEKNSAPTMESTFAEKIVLWELLENDIIKTISNDNLDFITPEVVLDEINAEKRFQNEMLDKLKQKGKLTSLQVSFIFLLSKIQSFFSRIEMV